MTSEVIANPPGAPYHRRATRRQAHDRLRKHRSPLPRQLQRDGRPPPARRHRLALPEDCTYTDPNGDLTGRDAIDAYIAGVQKQFPGVVFTLAGKVDAHHDQARFTWHVGPPGAAPVAVGFDVAVFENGRIRRVYGFLDSVPVRV